MAPKVLDPKGFSEKYSFVKEKAVVETVEKVTKLKARMPTTGVTDALLEGFKLEVNFEIRKLILISIPGLSGLTSSTVDTKEGTQTFLQDSSTYSSKVRSFIIDLRLLFSEALKAKSKYEVSGFSAANAQIAQYTIDALQALNFEESTWIDNNRGKVGKEDRMNKLTFFSEKRNNIIKDSGPIGKILTLSFADLMPEVKMKFLNLNLDSKRRMTERQNLVEARRKEIIKIYEKEGTNFDISNHLPKV
jgi:hypothetical protein